MPTGCPQQDCTYKAQSSLICQVHMPVWLLHQERHFLPTVNNRLGVSMANDNALSCLLKTMSVTNVG